MRAGKAISWLSALRWLTLFVAVVTHPVWANTTHIVKRGETLYGIARSHKVSVGTLAERNGLNHHFHVYTGQRLIIPGSNGASTGSLQALPSTVQRVIERTSLKPGRWKAIVIHHSGTVGGSLKAMDRYHRYQRHMENGLAYHFVIGNGHGMADGQIAVGTRWTKQIDGGHLAKAEQNAISLGICLVGNFDRQTPSRKQMQQLTALALALLRRCNLPPEAVKTHQQAHRAHTRCPGKNFPTSSWLRELKALRP